jgi:hypothetical protein
VTASRVSRRREMKEDGIENIEPNEGRELVHRVAKEWLGEAELIPISHLRLDLAEPISGWASALLERGLEILVDDLGRPCVRREVLGDLLREDRERLARIEAESAERAAAAVAPVPAAGIPALGEGASAMESIMAHDPGYQTATQEFGRPAPNFLAEELEAGRRADADRRSEAELLKKAQACSTGRTTSKEGPMAAEEVIAAGLERRIGSLPLGTRLRLILDQPIVDPTTHRLMPGRTSPVTSSGSRRARCRSSWSPPRPAGPPGRCSRISSAPRRRAVARFGQARRRRSRPRAIAGAHRVGGKA